MTLPIEINTTHIDHGRARAGDSELFEVLELSPYAELPKGKLAIVDVRETNPRDFQGIAVHSQGMTFFATPDEADLALVMERAQEWAKKEGAAFVVVMRT